MANSSKLSALLEMLTALLRIDARGEYIVEKLNQALVDERKRQLLLMKLQEIDDALQVLGQDIVLTQSEGEVFRIMQDARKPLTTAEVQDRATGDSLRKFRQHASATLNGLVDKGLLGKVRVPGRQVYFAPAREAVKLGLTQLGQSPDAYDAKDLSDATGLPPAILMDTVNLL